MRNIRSESNYYLGNKPTVVSLTNLVDLWTGKRDEGDRIWSEVNKKVLEFYLKGINYVKRRFWFHIGNTLAGERR